MQITKLFIHLVPQQPETNGCSPRFNHFFMSAIMILPREAIIDMFGRKCFAFNQQLKIRPCCEWLLTIWIPNILVGFQHFPALEPTSALRQKPHLPTTPKAGAGGSAGNGGYAAQGINWWMIGWSLGYVVLQLCVDCCSIFFRLWVQKHEFIDVYCLFFLLAACHLLHEDLVNSDRVTSWLHSDWSCDVFSCFSWKFLIYFCLIMFFFHFVCRVNESSFWIISKSISRCLCLRFFLMPAYFRLETVGNPPCCWLFSLSRLRTHPPCPKPSAMGCMRSLAIAAFMAR